MPRERSTWNRDEIVKRASHSKVADPYLMNQDHVKQQPSAEQYMNGDPSKWAEDPHPSTGTWEAEYSGGQVKRNEIGQPEMRKDTFNHPEKTAAVLTKKAALCVDIARVMLPKTASEIDVEDQAVALMHLPDTEVMATYTRLAAAKQAEEQEQDQGQEQGQQQQQQDQGQKQAGEMPPQFKENAEKKKEEAKKDQGQDQEQQKQAARVLAALQKGDVKTAQELLKAQIAQSEQACMPQAQMQQQGDATAIQAQLSQLQQQVASMIQQAQGQGQPQQQQPMQGQGQQQAQMQQQANDQLIDQMLANQGVNPPPSEVEIELDAPSMDTGEVQLGPEDQALQMLFANDEQVQQAQQAEQQQDKQAAMARTASMRTVGTRPTQGVSQIGGLGGAGGKTNDVDRLASIWNSAPNVSEAFGLPNR